MNRKRVLYIARYSTGGSAESLLCLIQGLDRSRFEPVVLFYFPPKPSWQKRYENAGARVLHLYPGQPQAEHPVNVAGGLGLQERVRRYLGGVAEDLYAGSKSWMRLREDRGGLVRDLEAAIGLDQPDIVHFNNDLVTDLPGIDAVRQTGLPAVCHVRAFSTPNIYHRRQARNLERIICISRAIQDHLINAGLPAALTQVVHNAVDLGRFTAPETAAPAADKPVSEREFKAVVVGRLDHWKGQDDFMQAMALLSQELPGARGMIVGDLEPNARNRSYLDKLMRMQRDLDLEERVVFMGERDDVPDLLSQADVAVLSSSSPEPFGRVIIESMAVGTPVVATAAGGVLDIIRDGENGLLVAPRDPPGMAKAIGRLAADPELAATLSAAGRQTVEQEYSVSSHVERMTSIYDEILQNRAS